MNIKIIKNTRHAVKNTTILLMIFCFAFFMFKSEALGVQDYLELIDKGIALYEKGDFDKAIKELRQAITFLKDKPDDDAKSEGLFTANLYIGMAYLGKGKETLAKDAFKNAFKAAPGRTLNPDLYPPKVISLYKGVVSQNLSSVAVRANIPDAEVFVDDEKHGTAPITIKNLLPGMHVVKVVSGNQEINKTVQLEPGKQASVSADFQKTGSISITSEPSPANVFFDGKPAGETPMLIKDVTAGEHTINLGKEGFLESKQKIIVREKETTETRIVLSPVVYSIRISSTPDSAEIFMDEVSKGLTPLVIENITPGPHKIRIVKEGYGEQVDMIDIKATLTEKTYRLDMDTGGLNVKTDPSDAEVLIDGKSFGRTPLNVGSLTAKQYNIKLKKSGYSDKDITVVIAKDKVSELNETLLETDTQKPEIVFEPPAKVVKENKNFIRAKILDNQGIDSASAMLRMEGEMNFQSFKMESPLKGMYEALIPEIYLKKDAVIEYYIFACDLQNNCEESGSKEKPYRLKVVSLEPYTEGYVINVDNNGRLTISIGAANNVKKNSRYIVFRAGNELKDPKTGELLQIEEIFVGVLRVAELMPNTAYAEMEDSKIPVAKNDRIRKQVSAPTGFASEGSHATKIALKWSPNREPEVRGYRIFRSSAKDGNYQKIGEISGRDNIAYVDSENMKEGMTFYYKIAAYNIFDTNGVMSEPIIGATKKGIAPPANIKADEPKVREVTLVWNISKQDTDTERFIIYKSETEDGQFKETGSVYADTNTFSDKEGLKDGRIYYYKIASKSKYGSIGEMSKAVAVKTKEGPLPPQKIRAFNGMVRMTKIQWDKHPDGSVAGYAVYRNEKESGEFTEIKRVQSTEFTDKGLLDGKTYYYSIAGYYSVKGIEILGQLSKPVSAETKRGPKAPKDLSAESGLAKKVVLKWSRNEEKDVKEYWIYKITDSKIEGLPFAKVKANETIFTETDLKNNTRYTYAVKAVDSDGLEGDMSNQASAVTKPLPQPPKALKGELRDDKAALKWEPNKEKDIKGYNVYKKGWLSSSLLTMCKETACVVKLEEKTKSIKLFITAVDSDNLESEASETLELAAQ